MAISFGPKLGLLYNALINETYFDSLRLFLQSMDQLVNGSVINATQVSPPTSPNPGDAYLLIGGTPGGAWTGQAGKVAVWDAQLTQSGTNNVIPGWLFLTPQAGWLVWNVATSTLLVFNSSTSAWQAANGAVSSVFTRTGDVVAVSGDYTVSQVTGAAASGVNADITRMTDLTTTVGDSLVIASPSVNANHAIIVTDGTHTSSWSSNGSIVCGQINSGNILGAVMQASGGFVSNSLQNATPGTAISVGQSGGGAVALAIAGTGVLYDSMLGFTSYPTQTTVGAAGGASALPATPTGYLPISIAGTIFIMPYYDHV